MGRRRRVKWLQGELGKLVEEGILSSEAAERLRDYYSAGLQASDWRRVATTILSIVGAILVGGGIILVLAHNWPQLSRAARAVVALAPLCAAQVLAGWVLLKRSQSIAWREGVGVFLAAAVAVAVAVVGQTYHVSGDLGGFLLTWALVSVPVVYLLGTSTVAVLYLVGITAWAFYSQEMTGEAWGLWPLAGLAVPYLWVVGRPNPYSLRAVLLYWAVAVCGPVAVAGFLGEALENAWVVAFPCVFGVMYLVGRLWLSEGPTVWRQPFRTVGAQGIGALAFFLSIAPWAELDWPWTGASTADIVALAVLLLGAMALLGLSVRRRQGFLYGLAPLLAVACALMARGAGAVDAAQLLSATYLLALALFTLTGGIRSVQKSAVTGGGILLLALLGRAAALSGEVAGLGIVFCASVLTSAYMVGRLWVDESHRVWQFIFHAVGVVGLGLLALVLTYREPWDALVSGGYAHMWEEPLPAALAHIVVGGVAAGAIAHTVLAWRRGMKHYACGWAPILTVAACALVVLTKSELPGLLAFNAFVIAMGVEIVLAGARSRRMWMVNEGVLVLAVLTILRFFQADLPLAWRGVAFIVVGAGFLAANLLFLRTKRGQGE